MQNPISPISPMPRKPSPRRNGGGRSSHLSPLARVLVVERILSGDSNVEINAALRKAGHLPSDSKGLSNVALWAYRKSDAVRVKKELLTMEAQQVGHAALSEAIVVAVTVMRSAARALLSERGKFGSSDLQAIRTMAYIFFKAADFIWDRLGMEDPLGFKEQATANKAARAAEAVSAAELARAKKEAEWLVEIVASEQARLNQMLAEIMARNNKAANDTAQSDGDPVDQGDPGDIQE